MSEDTIFTMNVAVRTSSGNEELQPRTLKAEDLKNYIVLREILGMFERRMVEYFFAGETAKERAARGEEIRLAIKDIPNPVWAENPDPCHDDGDCPSGQVCRNGVCVSGGNKSADEVATTAIAAHQVTG